MRSAVEEMWTLPTHLVDTVVGDGSSSVKLGVLASYRSLDARSAMLLLGALNTHPADEWDEEVAVAFAWIVARLTLPLVVTDKAVEAASGTSWLQAGGTMLDDAPYSSAGFILTTMLMERKDLPAAIWTPVLAVVGAELANRPGETPTRHICTQVFSGVRTPGVPVSLLGTLWRTLYLIDPGVGVRGFNVPEVVARVVENYLSSPEMPAVLTLRMLGPYEQATVANPSLLAGTLRKVTEQYPDLEGLPQQMLWEVAISQEPPAEWFLDWYQQEDGVTVLAPLEPRW